MAGNKNSGRKPKPNAKRTSVHLSNEVYDYLNRNGNVSNEIEKLVEDKMKSVSNTSYELLGIDPEKLAGYSVEQIAQFIRDVPRDPETPGMTEEEIMDAARQIEKDAN